jgi:hypothetical protein
MTNIFRIGFFGTFLLAIYYLVALFCYLPDDSTMHSKSAMEGACFSYLLGQSFISIAFFVLVVIGNPQNLTGVGKRKKNRLEEDVILDDLEESTVDPLEVTQKQEVQFVRGINFMNIAPTLVLFFLLWFWTNDLLIIVLTIPWAIIQGLISFLFMFVKDDSDIE